RRGGLSFRHRRDTRGRRPPAGTAAVRDDAVLGDRRPGSIARRPNARVGRELEAAPKGGVLHHAVGGAGQCPPGLRRPGGGDRAVASRAGGGRHRDRRRDSRRRGGRDGSDRRVPAQGLPGAGWRRDSVLSPARAPRGSRTRRDPHLQLKSRLPPLPRGALENELGWKLRYPSWRRGFTAAYGGSEAQKPARRAGGAGRRGGARGGNAWGGGGGGGWRAR